MNSDNIESKFVSMGARLRVREVPIRRWNPIDYAVDIQRDRRGEFFELLVTEGLRDRLEMSVLQVKPRERHLLLLVRRKGGGEKMDRFLCGHDERAWFVAAVPDRVSTVANAMESLKPSEVRAAQTLSGLRPRTRNRRKNAAFRRQGEWFFVPAPWLEAKPDQVLYREPIRRGAGKPHLVEELYREGGTTVYVCVEHPNGVTEEEYQRLIREDASRAKWPWRLMKRDALVYARGEVRHPDHRTITLETWHRVLMNTETRSRTMRQVAFLD